MQGRDVHTLTVATREDSFAHSLSFTSPYILPWSMKFDLFSCNFWTPPPFATLLGITLYSLKWWCQRYQRRWLWQQLAVIIKQLQVIFCNPSAVHTGPKDGLKYTCKCFRKHSTCAIEITSFNIPSTEMFAITCVICTLLIIKLCSLLWDNRAIFSK